MSQEGPQSAYVNPSGHVHETLTLYKAKSIRTVGASSTEYSWFPGYVKSFQDRYPIFPLKFTFTVTHHFIVIRYAWTISVCAHCDHHMGWRFTAVNRKLRPRKFWGISRLVVLETLSFNP